MSRLFWDIEISALDLDLHADYVMQRIMTRGSLEAMRWLRQTYRTEQLADYLNREGERLAPRDAAYWRLIANLPKTSKPGGARQPWMGS